MRLKRHSVAVERITPSHRKIKKQHISARRLLFSFPLLFHFDYWRRFQFVSVHFAPTNWINIVGPEKGVNSEVKPGICIMQKEPQKFKTIVLLSGSTKCGLKNVFVQNGSWAMKDPHSTYTNARPCSGKKNKKQRFLYYYLPRPFWGAKSC